MTFSFSNFHRMWVLASQGLDYRTTKEKKKPKTISSLKDYLRATDKEFDLKPEVKPKVPKNHEGDELVYNGPFGEEHADLLVMLLRSCSSEVMVKLQEMVRSLTKEHLELVVKSLRSCPVEEVGKLAEQLLVIEPEDLDSLSSSGLGTLEVGGKIHHGGDHLQQDKYITMDFDKTSRVAANKPGFIQVKPKEEKINGTDYEMENISKKFPKINSRCSITYHRAKLKTGPVENQDDQAKKPNAAAQERNESNPETKDEEKQNHKWETTPATGKGEGSEFLAEKAEGGHDFEDVDYSEDYIETIVDNKKELEEGLLGDKTETPTQRTDDEWTKKLMGKETKDKLYHPSINKVTNNIFANSRKHTPEEETKKTSLKRDLPQNKYTCNVCGKILNRAAILKNIAHMAKHSVVTVPLFSCNKCGKAFERLRDMRNHMIQHRGREEHSCIKCGLKYTSMKYLFKHEIIHKREEKLPRKREPRICDLCGAGLSCASTLKRHLRLHNVKGSENIFPCDERCGKIFRNKKHLEDHINIAHQRRMNYPCTKCGKNFGKTSNLINHMERKLTKLELKLSKLTKVE